MNTSIRSFPICSRWRTWCSRAPGANAVFELLALNKPSVLVPLSKASTRGDQLLNAVFQKNGYALVLDQNTATPNPLPRHRRSLSRPRTVRRRHAKRHARGRTLAILDIIRSVACHE
jgi:UDP-N-acetylglucosamine:LPS N-acetylglucosamine transferase